MCIVPYFMEPVFIQTVEPVATPEYMSADDLFVEDSTELTRTVKARGQAAIADRLQYRHNARKQSWV